MKLELKHLAPYLPYKLQGVVNEEEIHTLLKLSLKYDQNPMWIDTFNNIESTKGESEIRSVFPEGFKPILRNLSDLTKEIEVNGEKFVPMEKIEELFPDEIAAQPRPVMNNKIIEMAYYNEYQKLFEWHFDVFGLIPEGLAIDINTLQS